MPSESYAEYRPPAGLDRVFECAWIVRGKGGGDEAPVERIVPDGCAEIIVHGAERFRRYDPAGSLIEEQPRSFLAGFLTRFWLVRPAGAVRTIGFRLRPGGVGALFPGPAADFRDRATPLVDLWGRRALEFEEQMILAADDRFALAAGWAHLRALLAWRPAPDPLVACAVRSLARSGGRIRLRDLASACGAGPRRLERRFRDAVGAGPKTLARIIRFQALLGGLRSGAPATWTEAALAAGYYDHAHLVRDFRAFTGQSPSRFAAGPGALARCFAPPERLAMLLDGTGGAAFS